MIDVIVELETTRDRLKKRSLGINYALREEKNRLLDLGVVPKAFGDIVVQQYKVPEITAYWLLSEIAGSNTGVEIPTLLYNYQIWEEIAEEVLNTKEKN